MDDDWFIWWFVLVMLLFSVDSDARRYNDKDVAKICHAYSMTDEFDKWTDGCELISSIAKVETGFKSHLFNPEKTGSYGLLQIQCSTAKMIGLKYSCEQLFEPKINIRFGMKYIIYLRRLHKISRIEELIAAWNAGSPIYCKSYNPGKCYPGEFINQKYVWKVSRHYKYLMGDSNVHRFNSLVNSSYFRNYYGSNEVWRVNGNGREWDYRNLYNLRNSSTNGNLHFSF